MKTTLLSIYFVLAISILAYAQVTTSSISGKITDDKGEDLPAATITVVYKPTNTVFGVLTNVDGRYTLRNLNPGGPYDITATFVSYETKKLENITLKLGETLKLDFQLSEESTTLQEVQVIGDNILDLNKTGASNSVGKQQLQTLPTLTRSFSDFTRLTPQASNNSFAGTNFRYNNITLDGAINNDAIGFSPSLGGVSGTANQPGSSTRTNSFSLDAIQEVQVQLAPYDVTLGNFTGGSVNAISRSGSNDVSGSVYGFGRNSSITGKYKGEDKVGDGAIGKAYHDYQTGFRLGFPLVKDKLFWFTNEEITRSQIPLFYPAGAPNYFMTTEIANQIANKLKDLPTTVYNPTGGYDPGAMTDYNIYSKSVKFFNRLDWIINKNHSLAIRNNAVISEASNLERSTTEFQFGNYDFIQKNHNISTVAELKSRFGNTTSNSLILGYTDITDTRNPQGTIFPQIQINGIGSGHVLLGSNREAAVFNMHQKTFEVTDNFRWFTGNHSFTFGTHNEFYKIDYTFINSYNGRFDYASLADFLADKPSRMRAIYNPGDNSLANNLANSPAKFNISMNSLYIQDELAAAQNLVITYGLRADVTLMNNTPPSDAHASFPNPPANYGTTYTYSNAVATNTNKYFGQVYISPRVGFNYDIKGDKSIVLRGGSGLFTGRIPFAWLGYAYVNDGKTYAALDLNPPAAGTKIPTDPTQFKNFAAANGSANRNELDLIDRKFQMPRMWRSNLAVDFMIGDGYKLTLEALYTKTIKDVMIKQINLKDSVYYAATDINQQQPLYLSGGSTGARVSNNFSSVYLITNTNKGQRYSITAQLSKQYNFGFSFMAAYTYGQSKDILNGIRNSPESGWQLNQALNPNNPGLTYSNFDIRHRIVATAQYRKSWNERLTSYISLISTNQSGSPFTWTNTANSNLSRSGQQVDLMFIPAAADQIKLVDRKNADGSTTTAAQQYADLADFINSDPYLRKHKGEFTERNAARTPWNNLLDLRLMQDINFKAGKKVHTLQVTFDVINLSNMLNKKWGTLYFTPNTQNSSVDMGLRVTRANNSTAQPTYTFTRPTTSYSIDQFTSRWQGQVGLRYSF